MSDPQRLLCWSIYITKREDQSVEDHHAHVTKVNTPLTIPFLKKYGVVRYTVKHYDAHAKSLEASITAGQPEEAKLQYDCVFEMILKDIESLQNMQKDPEFLAKCIPDHFNFADIGRSKGALTWIEEFAF